MQSRKFTAAVLPWLFVLTSVPPRVEAFGPEGHVLVARVANTYLSAKARAGVQELLGDRSISDTRVANWADFIKKSAFYNKRYPKNATWHYADLPLGVSKDKMDESCKDGNCVFAAVKKYQAVLANPKADQTSRREALFFLVHFVGDLHQPLHCAQLNDDKGGNKRRVRLPGEAEDAYHTSNLHRVWDTSLVERAMGGLEVADYADRLTAGIDRTLRDKWEKGEVADWVLESNKVAKDSAYGDVIKGNDGLKGKPILLTEVYMKANASVIEDQIKKGGVRLARVLNDVFN